MRIPRLRLLIWFVLALGIVVAHRGSASVWLVGAVLALAAACLLINGRLPFRELDRLIVRYRRVRIALARPVGRHPWLTAAVLFVVVAVATASPWGRGIPQFGVHPWHDSASYLLEARMILEGHLVRPGLQHPEFFRTLHVLVTPIYCSKYPPGYPVIMATGLLAGHVEWVPPVLVSLAAAAVWLFGRRIVGRWSGLLAACAFATCPMILWLGTIHLSSTLSMLLGVLILGLWSVGHIRGRRPGLRGLVIGLLLSGMMLTRPFDAAALGVLVTIGQLAARGKRENGGSETPFLTVKTTGETPVPQFCHRLLAVGGVRSRANGRWLVALCLGGLPGVAGLLAYHQATTGDWKHGPYTLYEQQQSYSGQFLHGSPAPPPNLQSMPVNVRRLAEDFTAPAHRRHTFARLPLTIAVRFAALSRDLGFAMLLLPFVAPPAAWSCRAARPLIWVCIGFFAAYLLYAFDYPRYLAPIVAGLVWSMMAGLRSVRQESGSCAPDPNHGLPPRPKCGTARPPAATKVWPGRPARDPTGETPVPQAQEPPTLVGGHAQTGHTATPLPGPGALGPNDEPRCAVESVAQRAGLRPRRANGSKGAKGPYHVLELLLVALIVIGSFWAAHRLASLGLDPPTRRFHNLVASLPPGPKLIFVRYAPDHSFHREYVFNEPDLERAESIFAHDLGGERNVELMKANPDRRAYVYDEAARQMKPCS